MSSSQPAYSVIESAKNLKRSFSAQPVQRQRQRTSSYVYGFGVNSSALLAEHTDVLATPIEFLREYPDSSVVSVIGRASQTGPEGNNRQLSRDRADRVRAYLIASGVPEDRVGPVVFRGSEEPLVNVPGREEEMNRCVELVIEWVDLLVDPTYLAGDSMDWKLDLTVTFGIGAGIGGQVQMGTLTNLTTDESRPVSAYILGVDLGSRCSSRQPPAAACRSATTACSPCRPRRVRSASIGSTVGSSLLRPSEGRRLLGWTTRRCGSATPRDNGRTHLSPTTHWACRSVSEGWR